MNKMKYKEFMKRYDKFKKNNLPTRFWDEERQTLEYVSYASELDYWNIVFKSEKEDFDRKLNVNDNIVEALADIAYTGFYYSYTCGYFELPKKTDKNKKLKLKVGHTHSHSFEEVVGNLYDFPESFSISKDEEQYFSKQELEYLRRVQKYLLFLGLKDIESYKTDIKRYRNSRQKKYGSAYIFSCNDKAIKDFISGKRNFIVKITDNIDIYDDYKEFPKHSKKELLTDEEDNFKIFIEYTHQEIKTYKEIKKVYSNKNLKDNDKVVVEYFKILEIF